MGSRQRHARPAHSLAAGSRFDRYKPEQEKDVRKPAVKEDEMLKQLKRAWRVYHVPADSGYGHLPDVGMYYKLVSDMRLGLRIRYTAEDLQRFCIALAEFQDERFFSTKAGIFLSVLINEGEPGHYVIPTRHLGERLDALGYANTKSIVVEGDVGDELGFNMKGGIIVVHGDAGGRVGCFMTGGKLRITGDAGDDVGYAMSGGEIHIEGECGSLGEPSDQGDGGRIYHKGKLIDDGCDSDD